MNTGMFLTKDLEPSAYDEIYTNRAVYSLETNWKDTPYSQLYLSVAKLIGESSFSPDIVDLGCGVGHFAQCLLEKTIIKSYWGLDFSSKAIEIAGKRMVKELDSKGIKDPYCIFDFCFDVQNIYSLAGRYKTRIEEADFIVLLEVLEHIENDIDVLRNIPQDKRIILSVPNFFTKTHFRCFKTAEEVEKRYGDLIDFDYMQTLSKGLLSFFILSGRRV